jgi:hypothetical protein
MMGGMGGMAMGGAMPSSSGMAGAAIPEDVFAIMKASCGLSGCHTGAMSKPNLKVGATAAETTVANKAKVATELMGGEMPKSPGMISAADKTKLLAWANAK